MVTPAATAAGEFTRWTRELDERISALAARSNYEGFHLTGYAAVINFQVRVACVTHCSNLATMYEGAFEVFSE